MYFHVNNIIVLKINALAATVNIMKYLELAKEPEHLSRGCKNLIKY